MVSLTAQPKPSRARPSGISALGNVAFGTHLCQFYKTQDDVNEIVQSFLLAGLDANERCIWMAQDPMSAEAARELLRAAGQARRLSKRQVEVVDSGPLSIQELCELEERALSEGFDGLRVAGDVHLPAPKRTWDPAREEPAIHAGIRGRHLLALCSYCLDRCEPHQLLDVLNDHALALARHDGKWTVIHSATALLAEVGQQQAGASSTRIRSVPPPSSWPAAPVAVESAVSEGHDLRFYDGGRFTAAPLAATIAAKLHAGGGVLVAASAAHAASLREALAEAKVDVEAALRRKQLVIEDAEAVLAELLVDNEPSAALFDAKVGAVVRALCRDFPSVYVYGEVVDLVCRRGRADVALAMEAMWNHLRAERPFELVCGYALDGFGDAAAIETFTSICGEHARLDVSADEFAAFDRERLCAHLRQRTLALRGEVEKRRQLESEHRKLFEAERQTAARADTVRRHLMLLQRATSALSEAATVAEIAEVVHRDMVEALGATRASFIAVPEESPGRLPITAALEQGTSVWLSSPEEISRAFPDAEPAGAIVALPLTAGTRRQGALAFEFAQAREFTTADRAFIEDLGRQLALALDRATLYEAATEAREQAENASRAKDEFMAMLGHELRNPLSPMLTALQLMRLRAGDVALRERAVIERQVHHMCRLVDDLLDVSRITRGELQLARRTLELSDVVAHAIEMASPLLEERAHRLRTCVPHNLMVVGDPDRLAQVVSNVLTNAAKYTPNGGHIEVTAESENGRVLLRVRDNGNGIDAALLPRIFDTFVQGHQSIDRSRGGLGLGLSIVRKLVEMHGGTVTAFSEGRGKGSTFTIDLPLVGAPESVRFSRVPGDPKGEAPIARAARILVVDDNEDAAVLLAEALNAVGYVTRVAHDGPGALAVAEEFEPELALLDIGLPVMDGYELAGQLRARCDGGACPKLVAVTGYGQSSDRARAKEAGFDELVVKPVDLARLEPILRRLLPE
jgi:signal transduction histidine kinase